MWIHLLSLGLIDGATGAASPDPIATDTHDGWWAKQRAKEKKKKVEEQATEQLEQFIEQVTQESIKARPAYVPIAAPVIPEPEYLQPISFTQTPGFDYEDDDLDVLMMML